MIRLPLDELAVRRLIGRMSRTAAEARVVQRAVGRVAKSAIGDGDDYLWAERMAVTDGRVVGAEDALAMTLRWARRYCPAALVPRKPRRRR